LIRIYIETIIIFSLVDVEPFYITSFWIGFTARKVLVVFVFTLFHHFAKQWFEFLFGDLIARFVQIFKRAHQIEEISYVLFFITLFNIIPECMPGQTWFLKRELLEVFILAAQDLILIFIIQLCAPVFSEIGDISFHQPFRNI